MGISFDYDFGTKEITIWDIPEGSKIIVDGVEYVPELTCNRGEEFWECTVCGLHGLREEWYYCPNCRAKVVK